MPKYGRYAEQSVATTATPQFARLGLGTAADATILAYLLTATTTGIHLLRWGTASAQASLYVDQTTGFLSIATSTAHGLRLGTGAADRVYIASDAAEVGIGTAPADNVVLHLSSANSGVGPEFRLQNTATGGLVSNLNTSDDANGTLGGGVFYVYHNGAYRLCVPNAAAMFVPPFGSSTGNTGQIALRELAANGTSAIIHRAPDALASDLTFTWPTAYPAATLEVLCSSAGVLSSGYRSGSLVQMVTGTTAAVATGTTVLPVDDTIPQQGTDGDEYLTVAITPKSTSNVLEINFSAMGALSISTSAIAIALFQDSTADALHAVTYNYPTASNIIALRLTHRMTAGTTSATTFKIRIGPAGAATFTLNGASGARIFGGVAIATLTVKEIAA